jgi:hypothetical protein
MSGPFSRLDIHSVGHWWKLDQLEMPSRRSTRSLWTISHVTVADVTSAEQAHLYKNALRSTNITWHKICLKNQTTWIQNMLERSEGFADWTKHHIQGIQGISPRVSARPSDQSTQLGYLSHLDLCYHSRSQKATTLSSGKISFSWVGTISLYRYHKKYFIFPVMITILIVLRCKASHVCEFLIL